MPIELPSFGPTYRPALPLNAPLCPGVLGATAHGVPITSSPVTPLGCGIGTNLVVGLIEGR